MPSPVLPLAAKALVSDPTATLCGNFKNTLLKLPILFYQLVNYIFDASGNPTPEFVASFIPAGSLLFSASLTTPTGYLICNGQLVNRTTYAALFTAIGVTYGAGDGTTTFAVPDYQDRFPIGVSGTKTLGDTGGTATVALTEAQNGPHKHFVATDESLDGSGGSVTAADQVARRKNDDTASGDYRLLRSTEAATLGLSSSSGLGTAHDNMPPWLACYILIKT